MNIKRFLLLPSVLALSLTGMSVSAQGTPSGAAETAESQAAPAQGSGPRVGLDCYAPAGCWMVGFTFTCACPGGATCNPICD